MHLIVEDGTTRYTRAGFADTLNSKVHRDEVVLSAHFDHKSYSSYRPPKRGWTHIEAKIKILKSKE